MSPLQFFLHYARPRVGRFTPSGLQKLADHLSPPAFLAWGPFLVLIDIPKALQISDPAPSLEELNAFLRESHPLSLD